MGTNSSFSVLFMVGLNWAIRESVFGFGAICALFVFFAVEMFRADKGVELTKFRPNDVDRDCAVLGLFNAGSEGLCLMLLILKNSETDSLYFLSGSYSDMGQ